MAKGAIEIGGMALEELVEKLTEKMSKGDALTVAGRLLTEAGHEMGRTFSYTADFAKTDPGCGAKFARTLRHEDWTDGQDLVQAEESSGELGFNVRFHAIETDLDSLGVDVQEAFSCLAEMRSQLSDRLAEIRAEINLINQDLRRLQTCCEERLPSPTVMPDGKYVGPVNWYGKWMEGYLRGEEIILLPKIVGPVVDGPGDPRVKDVVDLAEILTKDDKLKRFFKEKPVSKRELVEELGDLETDRGRTLEDLVDILPDQGRYSSAEGLLKAVSDRQAAAIRTGGQLEQVINSAFGGNLIEGSAVSEADVVSFQLIPGGERQAISAAGVSTLGDLAKQTPQGLATIMEKAGFDVGEGEAAGWIAAADVLMHSTH